MPLQAKISSMTDYLLCCYKNSLGKMLLMSLCICGCVCLDNSDAMPYLFHKSGSITVSYYIVNSMIFGGQLLPYFGGVFSSGVLAAENCRERLSEMSLYVIGRMGERKYSVYRTAYTCLGGAAVYAGGMLLFVVGASVFVPFYSNALDPEYSAFPYFSLLSHGSGMGYLCVILYLMALSGAFYGAVAMLCDVLFDNIYVVAASPLLVSCLMTRFFVLLRIPAFLRFDLWLQARTSFVSDGLTLVLCTAVVLLAVVLCRRIYYGKLRGE